MTAGGAENAEPEAPQALRIRLFGALEIDDGSRVLGPRDLGGARPKQVLELLLAGRGHRVPTDRLAEQLWGEELPLNAAGSLQTFVSVLRRGAPWSRRSRSCAARCSRTSRTRSGRKTCAGRTGDVSSARTWRPPT